MSAATSPRPCGRAASTRDTFAAAAPLGTRPAARARCERRTATHERLRDCRDGTHGLDVSRPVGAGGWLPGRHAVVEEVGMRILSRRQVFELLDLRECIAAVERAFRLHAEGRTFGPGVLGVAAGPGSFHIKAAGLAGSRSYFAAKTNANFPDNSRRFGLPTIRGTVVLADAETGEPLAMMDSASLTALRTGAATAVAATHLARAGSRSATIVGCGAQGEIQLAAIASVLPLARAWVLDVDPARAERLAARAQADLGVQTAVAKDLHTAL